MLFSLYYTIAGFTGAPFVPTGKEYVEQMLDDVELKAGEKFADLGAGDGRLVIAAARRGASAVGYEINPFLVVIAWLQIWKQGIRRRARVHWKSLWSADLRNVDVVSVYGIMNMMPRLEQKFAQELRTGTRVVSFAFPLPHWKPIVHRGSIRVYKKLTGI